MFPPEFTPELVPVFWSCMPEPELELELEPEGELEPPMPLLSEMIAKSILPDEVFTMTS